MAKSIFITRIKKRRADTTIDDWPKVFVFEADTDSGPMKLYLSSKAFDELNKLVDQPPPALGQSSGLQTLE